MSDLYDGFLSAEDRRGVKPPDHGVLPPLVRWGSGRGAVHLAGDGDRVGGAGAAVVSLPAANASRGLLAWAALAHETAGHDLLAADDGLRDELARAVREQLLAERMAPALADYWADRIDETASDVLGVLNMGPAAALGLVGYFRGLNGAWNGTPRSGTSGARTIPTPPTSRGPTSPPRRCGSSRSRGPRGGRTSSSRTRTGTSGASASAASR